MPRPLYPRERTVVPTEQVELRAAQPVWSVVPTGIRTPDRPARCLVPILTTLPRLQFSFSSGI